MKPQKILGNRLLVLGGYGVGNLGDEAILSSLIDNYIDANAVIVGSLSPKETRKLHRIEAVHPLSLRFLWSLLSSDTIVIGGGGMFSRYTGANARFIPLIGLLASLLGKKVHYTSIGAYGSTPDSVELLLKPSMRLASSISVRDRASMRYLHSIGIECKLVDDLALSLQPAKSEVGKRQLKQLGIDLARPILAIAPRMHIEPQHDKRTFLALKKAIPRLAERYQILMVPMAQIKYCKRENDAIYINELVKDMDCPVFILEKQVHPRIMLSIFAQADIVIGVRLHSQIFSHITRTPLIGISYAKKSKDFLETHGCFSLSTKTIKAQNILDAVNGLEGSGSRGKKPLKSSSA